MSQPSKDQVDDCHSCRVCLRDSVMASPDARQRRSRPFPITYTYYYELPWTWDLWWPPCPYGHRIRGDGMCGRVALLIPLRPGRTPPSPLKAPRRRGRAWMRRPAPANITNTASTESGPACVARFDNASPLKRSRRPIGVVA
jgi:hypothetical protein